MTKIGWEYISWTSTREVCCAVPSCRRVVSSGWARVDQTEPAKEGTPVLCVGCHGMIEAGVDPDPAAATPEWELANREERLREMLADG